MPREINIQEYVEEYVRKHPAVRGCLGKGVINYSKLARLIKKESRLNLSFEAIVAGCKRVREGVCKGDIGENEIIEILSQSRIEVKNKRECLIVKKNGGSSINTKVIEGMELIETANCYVFLYDKGSGVREKIEGLGGIVLQEHKDVVEIIVKCPRSVEEVPGVLGYLYSVFGEHGINVLEAVSCWTDTIIVIDGKDVQKVVEVLRF